MHEFRHAMQQILEDLGDSIRKETNAVENMKEEEKELVGHIAALEDIDRESVQNGRRSSDVDNINENEKNISASLQAAKASASTAKAVSSSFLYKQKSDSPGVGVGSPTSPKSPGGGASDNNSNDRGSPSASSRKKKDAESPYASRLKTMFAVSRAEAKLNVLEENFNASKRRSKGLSVGDISTGSDTLHRFRQQRSAGSVSDIYSPGGRNSSGSNPGRVSDASDGGLEGGFGANTAQYNPRDDLEGAPSPGQPRKSNKPPRTSSSAAHVNRKPGGSRESFDGNQTQRKSQRASNSFTSGGDQGNASAGDHRRSRNSSSGRDRRDSGIFTTSMLVNRFTKHLKERASALKNARDHWHDVNQELHDDGHDIPQRPSAGHTVKHDHAFAPLKNQIEETVETVKRASSNLTQDSNLLQSSDSNPLQRTLSAMKVAKELGDRARQKRIFDDSGDEAANDGPRPSARGDAAVTGSSSTKTKHPEHHIHSFAEKAQNFGKQEEELSPIAQKKGKKNRSLEIAQSSGSGDGGSNFHPPGSTSPDGLSLPLPGGEGEGGPNKSNENTSDEDASPGGNFTPHAFAFSPTNNVNDPNADNLQERPAENAEPGNSSDEGGVENSSDENNSDDKDPNVLEEGAVLRQTGDKDNGDEASGDDNAASDEEGGDQEEM